MSTKQVGVDQHGMALLEDPVANRGRPLMSRSGEHSALTGCSHWWSRHSSSRRCAPTRRLAVNADELSKHIHLRALQDTNEVSSTGSSSTTSRRCSRSSTRPRSVWRASGSATSIGGAGACFSRTPQPSGGDPPQPAAPGCRCDRCHGRPTDPRAWRSRRRRTGYPDRQALALQRDGGSDPARTLPIVLDVGTDNHERLADPEYIGWRHERIDGEDHFDFVERFVKAVEQELPGTLMQW